MIKKIKLIQDIIDDYSSGNYQSKYYYFPPKAPTYFFRGFAIVSKTSGIFANGRNPLILRIKRFIVLSLALFPPFRIFLPHVCLNELKPFLYFGGNLHQPSILYLDNYEQNPYIVHLEHKKHRKNIYDRYLIMTSLKERLNPIKIPEIKFFDRDFRYALSVVERAEQLSIKNNKHLSCLRSYTDVITKIGLEKRGEFWGHFSHGDFIAANILIKKDQMMLLDFEYVELWRPYFHDIIHLVAMEYYFEYAKFDLREIKLRIINLLPKVYDRCEDCFIAEMERFDQYFDAWCLWRVSLNDAVADHLSHVFNGE